MILPSSMGLTSLINIIISLLSIIIWWKILLNVRLELLLRHKNSVQIRLLHVFLSIIFGHLLARFVIDYLDWSRLLGSLIT